VSLGIVIPVLAQSGGGFDLTWSTLDGGGASSAGGGYQVSGTVGQPDASAAGAMSGGDYALTGGFWGVTFPVCTTFVVPDYDQDCDVDQDDLQLFEACASGPGIALAATCEAKDFDQDDDVDQSDFGAFQRASPVPMCCRIRTA
jgi:hypothetical protein